LSDTSPFFFSLTLTLPPPLIPASFQDTKPTIRIASPDPAYPQNLIRKYYITRPHAPPLSPAISTTRLRLDRA
jgi:hypothetical protein